MKRQQRHLKLVSSKVTRRHCTLLELIESIQDSGRGDDEVVATLAELIKSGEVVLCGTFATSTTKPSRDGDSGSATTDEAAAAPNTAPVRFAR